MASNWQGRGGGQNGQQGSASVPAKVTIGHRENGDVLILNAYTDKYGNRRATFSYLTGAIEHRLGYQYVETHRVSGDAPDIAGQFEKALKEGIAATGGDLF